MNIQRLSPQYAPEYRALMLEAYELHPDVFVSTVAERAGLPLLWWETRLQEGPQPSQLVFGKFERGKLAGVAGLAFGLRPKELHKARLYGLYVSSTFRGKGLGRGLVGAVLEQARARLGIKVVQLTVTQSNRAAQAMYERAGFLQFGLEPFAFAAGGKFLSKVHMWCNLEQT